MQLSIGCYYFLRTQKSRRYFDAYRSTCIELTEKLHHCHISFAISSTAYCYCNKASPQGTPVLEEGGGSKDTPIPQCRHLGGAAGETAVTRAAPEPPALPRLPPPPPSVLDAVALAHPVRSWY